MRLMPATRSARSRSRRDAARISRRRPPVGSPRSATMWRTPAVPISLDHRVDLGLGRGDAGQMRGRRQRGFLQDAPHGRVRALARRAAGAVGHRDEIGRAAAQAARPPPRDCVSISSVFGGKNSNETRIGRAITPPPRTIAPSGCADRGRARATPRSCRRSRAPAAGCGAMVMSRPAAVIHCATVSAAKPRRRCACSSRRNSRSCGAKSTTSRRPDGASTRAASRIARAAVVEEVQHLMDDDDVERVGRHRAGRRCRPAARCNGASPARSMPRARQQQHVERQSMPSPRSMFGAEQFEDAAGAGAEIEQRAERLARRALADRALHRLVGDVQLADAVPLRGVRAEIVLRRVRRARGAPRRAARGRASTIGSSGSSRAISARASSALPPRFGQAEERPGALAEALDQAGLDQQLEMARDARLRLAQDVGEVGDGQLGLGQQRQDAQPRRPRPPP